MGNGKPYVHVIVYNDPADGYVGLDVFATFEAALRQFNKILAETRNQHSDDPDWITELICREGCQKLYFMTLEDYEVFYRREELQN